MSAVIVFSIGVIVQTAAKGSPSIYGGKLIIFASLKECSSYGKAGS
jgi:hypothetical protein